MCSPDILSLVSHGQTLRGVITFSISALLGKGPGTLHSVHSIFTIANVLQILKCHMLKNIKGPYALCPWHVINQRSTISVDLDTSAYCGSVPDPFLSRALILKAITPLHGIGSSHARQQHIILTIDSIPYGNRIGNSALLPFHPHQDNRPQTSYLIMVGRY